MTSVEMTKPRGVCVPVCAQGPGALAAACTVSKELGPTKQSTEPGGGGVQQGSPRTGDTEQVINMLQTRGAKFLTMRRELINMEGRLEKTEKLEWNWKY